MSPHTQELWFLICLAIIAAAALVQIITLIMVATDAMKMRRHVKTLTERIEEDVMPTVKIVRSVLEEASPKIKLATDQVLEVSRTVRLQVDHINEALNDIVDKTHTQANRVDDCMTAVFNGIGKAGEAAQRTTGKTSRKMSAVAAGIRVGVEALRSRRKPKEAETSGD